MSKQLLCYIFIYATGFCLLPKRFDILISKYGESTISSPSNSQRPTFLAFSVRCQIKGLNTPTIIPQDTAKTKSAFFARLPSSLQYFLVHSYRLGLQL